MGDEMRSLSVSAPAASSLLARAVYSAVRGHGQAGILDLGPRGAVLELGKKVTLILFVWNRASSGALARQLREVMQQRFPGRLVVGILGGTQDAWQVLEKARPAITKVKVGQFHVDDRGELRSRGAGPVQEVLEGFGRTPPPSEEEWARLVEKSAVDVARAAGRQQEVRQFAAVLESRPPVVTWTLTGIILAVFGLEFAFGGTQSAPVLLRMGALSPEKVEAGEYWRLFSCTFLHSGPMHVLFNTYVLWVLGTQLERILGIWRFLLLYGLSCLGASLVSLAFLDGFSVGASGGLWGLLGAEAVLAWRPEGLLPRAMIRGARNAALINLGINVLNSFRPHVDMWAHFGGGAVGGILMLSGLLTRGVPRLGELEAEGRSGGADAARISTGPLLKAAGGLTAVLLLAGLAMGLANGRPWALKQPFDTVRTPLPELGISLQLPRGLELSRTSPEEGLSVRVGDLRSDPGAVAVTKYRAVPAEQRARQIEQLSKVPPTVRLASGPDDVTIAGAPGVTVTYRFDNGLEEELALVFLADALVQADVLRWPAFGDAVPRGYAVQVLDSLEPLTGE